MLQQQLSITLYESNFILFWEGSNVSIANLLNTSFPGSDCDIKTTGKMQHNNIYANKNTTISIY